MSQNKLIEVGSKARQNMIGKMQILQLIIVTKIKPELPREQSLQTLVLIQELSQLKV